MTPTDFHLLVLPPVSLLPNHTASDLYDESEWYRHTCDTPPTNSSEVSYSRLLPGPREEFGKFLPESLNPSEGPKTSREGFARRGRNTGGIEISRPLILPSRVPAIIGCYSAWSERGVVSFDTEVFGGCIILIVEGGLLYPIGRPLPPPPTALDDRSDGICLRVTADVWQ